MVRLSSQAPAAQALVAGDVQFVMLPLGTIKPVADAGRLRILAVTSPTRYPGLPDVPTVAETVKPGFNSTFWFGAFLPVGATPAVVMKLNGAFNTALKMEDIRKKILEFNMTPMTATPEQTRAALLADAVQYGEAARAAGVQPE